MLKKLTTVALASTMVVSLAACSSSLDKDQAASPAPGNKQVIKLLHWKQGNVNGVIEEINKDFEAKYPEYKIEYVTTGPNEEYKQAQRSRITANDVDIFPDLSGMRLSPKDWTPGAKVPDWQQWIESGLIADLSGEAFVKNYNADDIAQAGTFKDKVYAIPAGKVGLGGIFYNKGIFAKYNLEVPKTWDEFINVCETLKKNGVTPLGMAGKDVWPLKLPAFSLQAQILAGGDQDKWIEGVWKGTNKFNDPDAIEVLDKMKTIQDKYTIEGFMGIDYGTLPSYFATEKVAMMPNGTWEAPTVATANPNLKFGYFPLPGTENVEKNSALVGKYDMTWYVAEKGNKEGAIKWLEFFSQPENYTKFVKAAGFLPTQPNIKTDSEFNDNEVTPYMKEFKLAYEILMINRENVGEHLAAEGIHTEYLAPGGEFKTAKELADVQQKEWDAAKPK